MTFDAINPDHYKGGRSIEPIEVIEDWQLNYHLGSALKYISRNGRKPGEDPLEGLDKAIWYLQRAKKEIEFESQLAFDEQLHEELKTPLPFVATHEDVIEFEAWDASKDTLDPEELADVDAWGEWASRDDYKKRECRTLDKHKIAYTSKEGGYIFGHQKNGDVRILGTYGPRAMGQEVDTPDNAPSEHEPEFDPFSNDQVAYDNFIFKHD